MRTTLTVDDALILDLRATASTRGMSLKQLVNEALRAGLDALQEPRRRELYRCPTFSMGDPAGIDLDRALHVAAALEDEEVLRKLALRK